MTKRHFEAIAQEFSRALSLSTGKRETAAIAEMARRLATYVFRTDNPRFDAPRFYAACGLDKNGQP